MMRMVDILYISSLYPSKIHVGTISFLSYFCHDDNNIYTNRSGVVVLYYTSKNGGILEYKKMPSQFMNRFGLVYYSNRVNGGRCFCCFCSSKATRLYIYNSDIYNIWSRSAGVLEHDDIGKQK